MSGRPLHELGALEAAALMAEGTLTSAELVDHLLARIERLEPTLHALIAVHPDAREQAAAADARHRSGQPLSDLDGVPVLVKDNIEVDGLPGTAGSLALVGHAPGRDAPLVARLRAAGLVILAAANLSEWANFRGLSSTSGWSGVGGLVDNPWRSGHSAGGSSSGCGAALAARYAPLAVGTETDGSITCPASLCGIVGIKPTVGTVPVAGVIPIAASQDTPGPMARCLPDAAALLDVLTAATPALAHLALPDDRPRRFVLGAPRAWRTGHEPTDAVFDAAVARMRDSGILVVDLEVPAAGNQEAADEGAVLVHEMADDLGAYLAARPGQGPRSIAEIVAFNRAHADPELAHFGQEHFEAAAASAGRTDPGYAPARERNLSWAHDEVLGPALRHGVDALIAPAYGPAWPSRLAGGDVFIGGFVTAPAAIAGWPILTLPIGLVDGLPIGAAVVGPHGGEPTLVAVGGLIEAAVGWSSAPSSP